MAKKSGIISEFKEFISRGNVVDLAVGMIIGSAFTAIVNSLVNDLIMPFVGMLFGKIDFTGLKYVYAAADAEKGIEEAAIYYGNFIQAVINFLLIAVVIFLLVKGINTVRKKLERKKEEAAEEAPKGPSTEELLAEIRDLLKENK